MLHSNIWSTSGLIREMEFVCIVFVKCLRVGEVSLFPILLLVEQPGKVEKYKLLSFILLFEEFSMLLYWQFSKDWPFLFETSKLLFLNLDWTKGFCYIIEDCIGRFSNLMFIFKISGSFILRQSTYDLSMLFRATNDHFPFLMIED